MINVTEIQVYMTRNKMTKKELAKKIGTSPATITRWFKQKDMPMSSAEKIIDILNIPENEMIDIFFT